MGWIALLFIVVPAVELALLIEVGGWLGVLPTLGLIIVTGVVGAHLARQQGVSVIQRLQAETQAGRLPGEALLDGAIILFSGALLLTPGILTDFVGFMGLLPPARSAIKRAIRASMARAVARGDIRVQGFVVRQPPGRPYAGRRTAGTPMEDLPRGPVIDVTPQDDEPDSSSPKRSSAEP